MTEAPRHAERRKLSDRRFYAWLIFAFVTIAMILGTIQEIAK
jgi:hypothetical protein